jgi:predicted TIM-barrel fold metal-dependent hydrolase
MLDGHPVADVDIHLIEPPELWPRYIEPAYRDRAPFVIAQPGIDSPIQLLAVNGQLTPKISGSNRYSHAVAAHSGALMREWHADLIAKGWSAEAQLIGMDREGVDVAFLYPTSGLAVLALDNVELDLARAICRAYNNWLAEFADHDRRRLIPVAMVPMQDPEGAVAEARRAARELGMKGVFVRPEPIDGRLLSDPAFEPLWSTLEELDLAVGIHGGTHNWLPTLGAHRFHTRIASHSCSHPMEQIAALVAMVFNGVLERHPGLRVAFLEAGGGWLPYWLWRMEELYEQLAFEVPEVKRPPTEYFHRQCWISVEAGEPNLDRVAAAGGEDRLVISSDFPHPDHPPGRLRRILERPDLTESAKRQVLWDNTLRLYHHSPT